MDRAIGIRQCVGNQYVSFAQLQLSVFSIK
jgi:hypothetical protein